MITNLPIELLYQIFDNLDYVSLANMKGVIKMDYNYVWQHRLAKDFNYVEKCDNAYKLYKEFKIRSKILNYLDHTKRYYDYYSINDFYWQIPDKDQFYKDFKNLNQLYVFDYNLGKIKNIYKELINFTYKYIKPYTTSLDIWNLLNDNKDVAIFNLDINFIQKMIIRSEEDDEVIDYIYQNNPHIKNMDDIYTEVCEIAELKHHLYNLF